MSNETEHAYDVFISYSHKDEEWVTQTLLPRLERAGLNVCIDYRDLKPGVPRPQEMERVVLNSHKTLLILTPGYLNDAWAEFGNLMVQTLDPASRDRRFIPLLKEACDPPLRIRHLTYVDFFRPEPERQAIAWTQLLTTLGPPPVQEAPEMPTRAGWRELLGQIACFRGPVRYETLEALAVQPKKPAFLARLFGKRKPVPASEAEASLKTDLYDLAARGLLHHDLKANRYDLHPIVRRYAYDRLEDKAGTHSRLRDYFAAVPAPERVERLEDLAPAIELYHHTGRAGRYDEAWTLFRDRIWRTLYYPLGAYQTQIELLHALFVNGEDRPPNLAEEAHQAHAMNELANSYSLSGQPRRAVPLFERMDAMLEKRDDKRNLAAGLGNLADDQLKVGALRAAEANLRRTMQIDRETEKVAYEEAGARLAELTKDG